MKSSLETPETIYSLSSAFLVLVSFRFLSELPQNLLDDHSGWLLWEGVKLSEKALLLRASLQPKGYGLGL
jgi:hypothetical protein